MKKKNISGFRCIRCNTLYLQISPFTSRNDQRKKNAKHEEKVCSENRIQPLFNKHIYHGSNLGHNHHHP